MSARHSSLELSDFTHTMCQTTMRNQVFRFLHELVTRRPGLATGKRLHSRTYLAFIHLEEETTCVRRPGFPSLRWVGYYLLNEGCYGT